MSINIQARGFRLTSALRQYVLSKLEKILQRYRNQSPKVSVTLQDINGPRGGEDMRCRILLTLDGQRTLVIQETAEDMYDAIAVAASRAKWAVNRQFERLQDRKRKTTRRPDSSGFDHILDVEVLDEIDDLPTYMDMVTDQRLVS